MITQLLPGLDFVFGLEVEDGPPSVSAIPEDDVPPGVVNNLLADDDGVMFLVLAQLVGVCTQLLTLNC